MDSVLDVDALVKGTKSKEDLWINCMCFFDKVKGNLNDAAYVERTMATLDMTSKLLLFRGTESDVVQRLSAFDRHGKQFRKSGRSGQLTWNSSYMTNPRFREPETQDSLALCLPHHGRICIKATRKERTATQQNSFNQSSIGPSIETFTEYKSCVRSILVAVGLGNLNHNET
jgi:hypothetical protein